MVQKLNEAALKRQEEMQKTVAVEEWWC
jgi:hypothetical protein